MRWYRKLCLRATLAAANALFFGGAIWLLAAGARVRKAGWLDIFEDDYPWFHTVYVLLVVFLSLLVATLAISGLYSVLFKRKEWVIKVYAATSVLTLAFSAFLVIEGSISLGTAQSWKGRATIDAATETNVEVNFNQAYCLSQAAFLCTASSNAQWLVHFGSDDLRDLFLDAAVAAQVKQAMAAERSGAARSLLKLCEDEDSPLHAPVLSDSVANLCTWCGDIADLQSYVHLVAWANAKCPPSHASALFCVQDVWLNYSNPESIAPSMASPTGVFATAARPFEKQQVTTPDGGSVSLNPPYSICRKTFLSYWSYLSLWFLLLALAMLAFMVVVIRVAWITLRAKPDRYSARHGLKTERKPLVQLASQPPAPVSSRVPAKTKANAKPTTTMAKAKALLGKGKT